VPLLDIEKVIKNENLRSRFKLVHVAGLRARELNTPVDETADRQNEDYTKVTTTALSEIINGQVTFTEIVSEELAAERAAELADR